MAERAISCGAQTVALVMSGDTGFFSLTNRLPEALRPYGTVPFCGTEQYAVFMCEVWNPL